MTQLVLTFFGTFQAVVNDKPVTAFRSDKVRCLLAYLALEAGQPHNRESLAGFLWPDHPQATAQNNLRVSLSRLRAALGDQAAVPAWLAITHRTLGFNSASNHWIDVAQFLRLIEATQQHRHERLDRCASCIAQLQQATALYRGEFLHGILIEGSDLLEAWVRHKRQSLQRLVVDALFHITRYYSEQADFAQALAAARRQLELEPWREEAHRQMMELLAQSGQRSAALVQYEICRQTLADELGVAPARETVALYEQIKMNTQPGQRGAVASALPLSPSPPTAFVHNIPAPLTPFIGRHAELAELAERLADPFCRLLTLIGPGGSGKTRLAGQAATQAATTFRQGVCFVSLAPVPTVDFLAGALADGVGLRLHGGETVEAQLAHFLHDQERLLVLDNFEHLLTGRTLLVNLLQQAPGIKIMVTSRVRLNVQGEWLLTVAGLAVPGRAKTTDAPDRVLDTYPALQLFVQSARRVQQNFDRTWRQDAGEKAALVHICQLVDGLPLAIELAAAWTRHLTCQEIAREMAQNLDFLSTALDNVPERQRSLRAVFQYSWQLLAVDEKAVLARLAVFRAGFTREAFWHVTGASLTRLLALIDHSLLYRDQTGRYDLHELLRQYAVEKLVEAGVDAADTQQRHADFYTQYAAQLEQTLRGADETRFFAALSEEMENIHAAWHWALIHAQYTSAEQGLAALYKFYHRQSRFSEGELVFRQALTNLRTQHEQRPPDPAGLRLLGVCLTRQANFLRRLGQQTPSYTLLQESMALAQQTGDQQGLARALYQLGDIAWFLGHYTEARERVTASLALQEAIGDREGMATSLFHLGTTAWKQGEYARAQTHYSASLALGQTLGDRNKIANAIGALGQVALAVGQPALAEKHMLEALAMRRAGGYRWGIADALSNLGRIAAARGDYAAAQAYYRESLTIRAEIFDRRGAADVQNELAAALLNLGETAEAEKLAQTSLATHRALGYPWGEAAALVILGHIAGVMNNIGAAQAHIDAACNLAAQIDAQPLLLRALLERARLLIKLGDHEAGIVLLRQVGQHPANTPPLQKAAQALWEQGVGMVEPRLAVVERLGVN